MRRFSRAFKSYAHSYPVKIQDNRISTFQIHITIADFKKLFEDLLAEIRDFQFYIKIKRSTKQAISLVRFKLFIRNYISITRS